MRLCEVVRMVMLVVNATDTLLFPSSPHQGCTPYIDHLYHSSSSTVCHHHVSSYDRNRWHELHCSMGMLSSVAIHIHAFVLYSSFTRLLWPYYMVCRVSKFHNKTCQLLSIVANACLIGV